MFPFVVRTPVGHNASKENQSINYLSINQSFVNNKYLIKYLLRMQWIWNICIRPSQMLSRIAARRVLFLKQSLNYLHLNKDMIND